MATRVEAFSVPGIGEEADAESRKAFERAYAEWLRPAAWDPENYAHEQVCGLVRQIFCSGRPPAVRQVVISAVDMEVEVAPICAEIAEVLAEQLGAKVCLVEANWRTPSLERFYGRNRNDGLSAPGTADAMRKSSRQVSPHVWLASWDVLLEENGFSSLWLRSQLGELRYQFEYAVLHAPPAGAYSETALLGQLTDGVILVLAAHLTKRAAAQETKRALQNAHARLLGAILSERTFPIPERIYRKL